MVPSLRGDPSKNLRVLPAPGGFQKTKAMQRLRAVIAERCPYSVQRSVSFETLGTLLVALHNE